MKIQIKARDLLDAARLASAGLATRDIKPLLKSFALSALNGWLQIESTDLELGVVAGATCESAQDGSVCIPGNFTQLLEGLDEQLVSFDVADNKACIYGDGFNFELATQDTSAFPSYAALSGTCDFVVDSAWLAQAIKLSKLDIRRDDNDYSAISGFCLEVSDNQVSGVSTNRVILTATHAPCESDKAIQAIMPHKSLSAISSICGQAEKLKVSISRSTASFSTDNLVVWSRLIEGRYPPWRKAMDRKAELVAKVQTGDLHQAIKRACYFVSEETIKVNLAFGSSLVISNTSKKGDGSFVVPCNCLGVEKTFAASGPGLRAVLSVHKADEELCLSLTASGTPSLVIDFAGGRHVVAGIS